LAEAVTAFSKLWYYEIFISPASIRANFELPNHWEKMQKVSLPGVDDLCTNSMLAVTV